ncbi:inositol oxygenase-like [Watersipora subatra]|uniref:inositol oxygenase-like n=1 Tax=Watersipora subatra TaxID=2589382 RepID=UPI00355BC8EE
MRVLANEDHHDGKEIAKDQYRIFDENPTTEAGIGIKRTYYEMHPQQTVEFVKAQHEKWCKFDHLELTIMEAVDLLADFVDESDPDAQFANSIHAFQTAEAIRAEHPDDDWFQLTGLIHDLGKVMAKYGQPQWCTVGDTYPVGLAPRDCIAFGVKSFQGCPDLDDSRYNTKLGMYKEHCGLDNVLMSWGHDEYLYQVLKNHPSCTLPKEGLWCIRYHSFYPLHRESEYLDLLTPDDEEILGWIKRFSPFDLYSKTEKPINVEELKPYYQQLIDKYIPGKIKF